MPSSGKRPTFLSTSSYKQLMHLFVHLAKLGIKRGDNGHDRLGSQKGLSLDLVEEIENGDFVIPGESIASRTPSTQRLTKLLGFCCKVWAFSKRRSIKSVRRTSGMRFLVFGGVLDFISLTFLAELWKAQCVKQYHNMYVVSISGKSLAGQRKSDAERPFSRNKQASSRCIVCRTGSNARLAESGPVLFS